jgi:tRNA A37 threonylcarbamoyladenosine modification protein TsaB
MERGVEVVVVPFQTPILVGVYRDRQLERGVQLEGKVSETLPPFFEELLRREQLEGLYYSRGPGSFMGVRLTFLFLKTLSIIYQIPFRGVDSFYFTGGKPIKGPGASFFVKKEGIIVVSREVDEVGTPSLPPVLNPADFEEEVEPLYLVKAV